VHYVYLFIHIGFLRLWALILGMPLSTRTLLNTPSIYLFIYLFVIPTRYLSQGKMKEKWWSVLKNETHTPFKI
jgi:hypothetical protein